MKYLAVVFAVFVGLAHAAEVTVDGVSYRYKLVDDGIEITGVESSRAGLVIPSQLSGLSVASIGQLAVWNGTVENVEVSEGIKRIGRQAFFECIKLKTVKLPLSLQEISESAFSYCNRIESMIIPFVGSNRGASGESYFGHIFGVKNNSEFKPTKWSIPSTLKTVIVKDDTKIAASAFKWCDSLTRVTIPNTVEALGKGIFSGCSSLQTLEVPFVGENRTKEAAATVVYLGEVLPKLKYVSLTDCPFVADYAFNDKVELKTVSLNGVKNIGKSAFEGCSELSSSIPKGVTNIGSRAFVNCAGITSLTLPDGVISIGDEAFRNCSNISSIFIESDKVSLRKIGGYAFYGCNITRVDVYNLNRWFEIEFGGIEANPLKGATLYARDSWGDYEPVLGLTIPNSVKRICSYAFAGGLFPYGIRISKSVTEIGEGSFYDCYCGDELIIPESVSAIGAYAFSHNSTLKKLKFEGACPACENSLLDGTSAGMTTYAHALASGWSSAFESGSWYNHPIRTIEWVVDFDCGEHGVRIGGGTLRQFVATGAATEPQIVADRGWRFLGWDKDVANVTSDMTVTAMYAEDWQDGDRIEEIVGGVTWYGTYREGGTVEFGGCSQTSGAVTIPQNIGGFSVTTIGDNVFSKMWSSGGPTAVVIPEGVTRIGQNFFFQSKALSSVVLPSSLTNIASGAFSQCAAIADIVFPADVVLLGAGAFSMCDSLTNVTFTGNAPTVGEQALSGLPSDCIVWVERGTTGWGAVPGVWNGITVRYIGEHVPLPTFGEALGATSLAWATSGDADWLVEKDGELGHYVARSGAIGGRKCSVLSTVVAGRGTLTFKWKVSSCSEDCYLDDYLSVCVDGEEIDGIGGEVGWVEKSIEIDGGVLSHAVEWRYQKDKSEESGFDCGWLADVSWTPAVSEDPIPELGPDADLTAVQSALENSTDERVKQNITDAATYGKYRDWAMKIGAAEVKASACAWVSFATDSAALLAKMPTDDDLKVEEFKPSATAGSFDFTVSVDGVKIGDKASEDNLKKLFGLEGAESLVPAALSSENVSLNFKEPQDGKLKFTATPAVDNAKSFFMKVKVK